MDRIITGCAVAILALGASYSYADNPPKDNTKVNQRDRNDRTVTAEDQSMSKSDTELTRKIREELMKDKTLSTYAHNVKIVTVDGIVTLRGPVRTESEKSIVEKKAVQIAGNVKVKNELEIAPAGK